MRYVGLPSLREGSAPIRNDRLGWSLRTDLLPKIDCRLCQNWTPALLIETASNYRLANLLIKHDLVSGLHIIELAEELHEKST